ncbi:fimbrial protein [Cronobacter dublinensis]|uniref:fimbrial protein n=1 Tax=Cronobacter dublinensis TaxID=413497 RepID=UPI000CFDD5E7|nr:fimbrial protein [Cronobacter dublinensis]
MKKVLLGLAITAALSFSAAHAEDVSSNLTVAAVIKAGNGNCTVVPSVSSISLSGKTDELITQGNSSTSPVPFTVRIEGDNACLTKVNEGHISIKFSGTASDSVGIIPVLANTDTGTGAAQGVGIGLFNNENNPVRLDAWLNMTTAGVNLGMQMVKLTNQTPVGGTVHGALTIDVVRL